MLWSINWELTFCFNKWEITGVFWCPLHCFGWTTFKQLTLICLCWNKVSGSSSPCLLWRVKQREFTLYPFHITQDIILTGWNVFNDNGITGTGLPYLYNAIDGKLFVWHLCKKKKLFINGMDCSCWVDATQTKTMERCNPLNRKRKYCTKGFKTLD